MKLGRQIEMPVNQNTRFTDISARFQPRGGPLSGDESHVRFDGRALYTHAPWKKSGLGDEALTARRNKWAAGATAIKQAIARQYGPDVAARVFAHLGLDQGVQRSDLPRIQQAIDQDQDRIHRAALRNAALQDPDLPRLVGNKPANGDAMLGFFSRNFEACTRPEFWEHNGALMNSENFGCGLALVLLNRVTQAGQLTEPDRQMFNRLLAADPNRPLNAPAISPNMVGPLTPQNRERIVDQMYNQFKEGGAYELNMGDGEAKHLKAVFEPNANNPNQVPPTVDDKVNTLTNIYKNVVGSQYFGSTLPDALRNILG